MQEINLAEQQQGQQIEFEEDHDPTSLKGLQLDHLVDTYDKYKDEELEPEDDEEYEND